MPLFHWPTMPRRSYGVRKHEQIRSKITEKVWWKISGDTISHVLRINCVSMAHGWRTCGAYDVWKAMPLRMMSRMRTWPWRTHGASGVCTAYIPRTRGGTAQWLRTMESHLGFYSSFPDIGNYFLISRIRIPDIGKSFTDIGNSNFGYREIWNFLWNIFWYREFDFRYPEIIPDVGKWIPFSDIKKWCPDIRKWFPDIGKSTELPISGNDFPISGNPTVASNYPI